VNEYQVQDEEVHRMIDSAENQETENPLQWSDEPWTEDRIAEHSQGFQISSFDENSIFNH